MGEREALDGVRPGVPEVMALEEVAAGRGASIVVAVAATIALVIAVVVAAVSTGPARAAPPAVSVEIATALMEQASPVRGGFVAIEAGPVRDGLFRIANQPARADKSIAMVVLTGLFLLMLGATSMLWRALGNSLLRPVRQPKRGRKRNP